MKDDKIIIDDLIFEKYILENDVYKRNVELSKELNDFYKDKNPLVIGVLNGCIYFMMDILNLCDFDYSVDFIRAKSYRGMESAKLNIEYFSDKKLIKDKYILIVEDIIDSGKTISNIYKKLSTCKPKNIKIISLLSKVESVDEIDIDWCGFKIENKYVIGYGLDYNNLFRNLKDIYKLNEEEK